MIGQLSVTHRRERSYNGVAAPLLKSGLQKYARRGALNQGLACLVELDLFSLIEIDPLARAAYLRREPRRPGLSEADADRNACRRATALRTNLLNRLLVMTSEEVNISCWWMPLVVDRLAEQWRRDRARAEGRQALVSLYKHLCAAKKARLLSDLKSVYLLPPSYVPPEQVPALRREHALLLDRLGLAHLGQGQGTGPMRQRSLPGLSEEVAASPRETLDALLDLLRAGSDHAFYWVGQWMGAGRGAGALWRVVGELASSPGELWKGAPPQFARLGEVVTALRKWHARLTHSERPIYLYHALLLVARRKEIDWSEAPKAIEASAEEVEALYGAHLAGRRIELDAFVRDRHTSGHAAGSQMRFALEGAWVANENTALVRPEHRRIYVELKGVLDRLEQTGANATEGECT